MGLPGIRTDAIHGDKGAVPVLAHHSGIQAGAFVQVQPASGLLLATIISGRKGAPF